MMRFIRLTALALTSVAMLTLAVTNRQQVTLYIDPLTNKDVAAAIQAPFFVIIFACLIAGVILGAIVMWLGQSRWRRQAKIRAGEVMKLKRDMALLETELASIKKGRRNLSSTLFGAERGLPH